LTPAQASLRTERGLHAPWGPSGGGSGQSGRNLHNGEPVARKVALELGRRDRLTLETTVGGGYGKAMG
jgi:N-methylhydantoinase B